MRVDLEPFATRGNGTNLIVLCPFTKILSYRGLQGGSHKDDSSRFCKCQKPNAASNEMVAYVLLIFAANCARARHINLASEFGWINNKLSKDS